MTGSKKHLWLLVALLLLVVAAWLMWSDKTDSFSDEKRVEFPNHLRTHERERLDERRRALSLLSQLGEVTEKKEMERDPLLVALSGAAADGSHVVFEVAELKDTPIGKIVTDCLARAEKNPFDELEDESGLDAMDSVERVAVAEDLFLLEGDFASADFDKLFEGMDQTTHGDTVVYSHPDKPGSSAAVWNGEMLIFAENEDTFDEAIGLLEGDVPYDETVLNEDDSYGEIYGNLDVDDAADMFPSDNEVGQRFSDIAEAVELHVDASDDVAMWANVTGSDNDELNELARSMGGLLSLGRIKARAEGQDDLAELLDFASVDPGEGDFEMEVALPLEYLEEKLADCKWAGVGQ